MLQCDQCIPGNSASILTKIGVTTSLAALEAFAHHLHLQCRTACKIQNGNCIPKHNFV